MNRREDVDVLERQGRLLDAAQLAGTLGLHRRAAQLYGRAGEHLRAALAFREERMLTEALRAVSRLPADDPQYRAGARLAIALAANLRVVTQELELFLAPYLHTAPDALEDRDALFLLGQLYEVLEYTNHALELFHRVARADPLHPVHAHMRAHARQADAKSTFESVASRGDVDEVRRRIGALGRPAAERAEPGSGQLLADRYRVQKLLGEGGSAAVYAVLDTALDEVVALKLFTHSAADGVLEARFRREVSLARQLVHKNIVRLFDLGRHGERRFLTMELLDGKDLRALIEEDTLDDRQKRELLLQALEGLGYAHEHRVTHRDVKPENLFVTSAGVLKIADFGIAKRADDLPITVSGSLGGTPYYISPDQIMSLKDADHRSDLYSLGVVAYELFARELPFESENITQLLLMHLEKAPRPLRALRPELPEALDPIVLKLLAKRPDERFQDCAQVVQALRAVTL